MREIDHRKGEMPHFLDLQLAVVKAPVMSAMLPEWIADFIAKGSEDAAELEKAMLALTACPLVKSIEPLSDATLEGARAVFNDFVRRSNKRFLFGCCPACDEPAWRFAKAFDADPSRLRTAAVAVRRADGKVMGAVVCTTHGQTRTGDERAMAPDPKPGTSLVEWIAVLPEARNRGIGSALLTHAFGAVRQTPWDATRSMKLTVVGGNRAKRLYDRLGFETVGPNGVLEKCVGGCALCCLIGCPYGRPCAGYDDMAKAL